MAKKVQELYVAMDVFYGNTDIIGVFSTRQKAEDALIRSQVPKEQQIIQPCKLDRVIRERDLLT